MATLADPIALIDDASLQRMERNAWREAARCWHEFSSVRGDPALSAVLGEAALSAEDYWRHLNGERLRRGLTVAA